MSADEQPLRGVAFAHGVSLEEVPANGEPLLGHIDGEAVLLVRVDGEIRALGATCTHYSGPLAEGVVHDGTVRCPWHHACFSLRTGEALGAPALNPLPTWEVRVEGGRIRLGSRTQEPPLAARGRSASGPESVVIIGAGAGGSATAEQLRREGYDGRVVLVDPDADAPYDRPNLSKDFLAGSAPAEWLPLRPPGFYAEHGIERRLDHAKSIDRKLGVVRLASGETLRYGALVLAPGAMPRRVSVPGADREHVHTLRSLADCRRIIRDAGFARSAVVLGAGFVGMEVAASLRKRGLEVMVVAPEAVPFERVLGAQLGDVLRRAHEDQGVRFRLGHTLAAIEAKHVVLDDGSVEAADLVIIGTGVVPDTALAAQAGLHVDNGIVVDEFLTTSDPRIHAAGDAARWPDPRSGTTVRVEHWVVAQRHGQAIARNIAGRRQPFHDVPFFWTAHFDTTVSYIGHADAWNHVQVTTGPDDGRAFRYLKDNRLLALATVGRDRLSLETEIEMLTESRQLATSRGS